MSKINTQHWVDLPILVWAIFIALNYQSPTLIMKQVILFFAAFFIYCNSFSQSVPDVATFSSAFKIIEPTIYRDFKKLMGSSMGKNEYGAPLYEVTNKGLPGTLTNFIEFLEADGYDDDKYYYMAPIDTTSSQKDIQIKMLQWKQMLTKALPEEAKLMKEETLSDSQTFTFLHREMSSKWDLTLTYSKKKGKYKMELYINKE